MIGTMNLRKCYIENFGKLHQFEYEFSEGLNIINKSNGWGKSTFATFIKAMFYGFGTSNKRAISENERKKYYPWQGGKFGGNLEFEINGKIYEIERFFGIKDKDDTFRLYDKTTNCESYDFSQNIGEEIFKLDRQAYERSTYISGQAISVEINDSLSAKLSNILENENDINTSEEAINRIVSIMKEYKKTGNKGKINEIETKINNKKRELEYARKNEELIEERRKKIEESKLQIRQYEQKKNENQEKMNKISEYENDQLKKELEILNERLEKQRKIEKLQEQNNKKKKNKKLLTSEIKSESAPLVKKQKQEIVNQTVDKQKKQEEVKKTTSAKEKKPSIQVKTKEEKGNKKEKKALNSVKVQSTSLDLSKTSQEKNKRQKNISTNQEKINQNKGSVLKKSKNKRNIFIRLLYELRVNNHVIFNAILILFFLIMLIGLIKIQVFQKGTIIYISCIILFLMLIAMSYNKYISGKVFTILLCVGMGFAIYQMQYTYDFIRNLAFNVYEYKTYYVVSFDNGLNKSVYNINNKKVGLLKDNCINVERKLNTKLDQVQYIAYDDINDLFDDFYEQKFRAVLVDDNQYKYLQNNIEEEKEVKILYEFQANAKK